MKKYLFVLVMIVSSLEAQENNHNTQMNFPYINNSLKLYAAFGYPTGIGLLYAPEIRSSINNNILHVINFDVKFLGFSIIPDHLLYLGMTASVQYSIGSMLENGGRFYVDLIGAGWGWGPGEAMYTTLHIIGFQNTLSNGFYWAVRTAVNFSTQNNTGKLLVGFEGYAALGYDFGKKINPKDYQSRMR